MTRGRRRSIVLKRLQVFNEVGLFLVAEAKPKSAIIAVDDVEKRFESAVVIEAAFVFRLHKQPAFAHEYRGQVHGLVFSIGRAISLETVNTHLSGSVIVPAWLGPERFGMAAIAIRFSTEERITSVRCHRIKINSRTRFWRGKRA